MKIEEVFFEDNKVIFLLVSLPDLYGYLVTSLLHKSKVLGFEEAITT